MKYEFDISSQEEDAALAVIQPCGHKLLVALPKIQDKVGSLYLPEARKADEEVASILAKVIAFGPASYMDTSRFPAGEYCKPGDVVMMSSYSGRRFKIHGREYRLINDDTVLAVVKDPNSLERACEA